MVTQESKTKRRTLSKSKKRLFNCLYKADIIGIRKKITVPNVDECHIYTIK